MSARFLARHRRVEAAHRYQNHDRLRTRRRRRLPARGRAGGPRLPAGVDNGAAPLGITSRNRIMVARPGTRGPRGPGMRRRRREPHRHDPASLRRRRLRDLCGDRPETDTRRPSAPAGILYAGGPPRRAGAGTGRRGADLFAPRTTAEGLRHGAVGTSAGVAQRGRGAGPATAAPRQYRRRRDQNPRRYSAACRNRSCRSCFAPASRTPPPMSN